MEQIQVFVSFFLDASRPNSDGKCLVKLNIYHKPHKKRYATIFHVTKDEWAKLNSSKLRDEDLKDSRKEMNALQAKAEKMIKTIEPFSFVSFEEVKPETLQDAIRGINPKQEDQTIVFDVESGEYDIEIYKADRWELVKND